MSTTTIIIVVILLVAVAGFSAWLLFGRGAERFTIDIGGGASPTASGGADASPEKGFRNRIVGVGIFAGGVLATLLARLWSMQLVSSDEYAQEAESNRTRTVTTAAPRGRILDRNGVELVTNRPSLTVTADPDVNDDEIEVQLLANLIGMPSAAIRRKIQNQSEGAQSRRTVAIDVSRRVVAYIEEHPHLFNGIEIEERSQRLYPLGSLAAHVLGYTGTITQAMLDGEGVTEGQSFISYHAGDTVGQSGIEYQYESVLQGVRGEQTVYVDADGRVLSYASGIDARSGSDVMLTLDVEIQRAAEESLELRIANSRNAGNHDCRAGSVVAFDVTNGEIIALASYPTYTPNVFIGGISNDDWAMLQSDDGAYPLMNRAIAGQYPSASTIKPLSTFAAMNYGIADATSGYYCSGYWTGFGDAYGQYCWEHNGHGGINLQGGITYSCDVVFYEIGKAFFYSNEPEGLQATYRRWGLGEAVGIDIPGEAIGRVPDAEWKWNYFTWASDDARSWQGGDTTNLVIGQGDLLVTPLQMASVYAGIATRGTTYRPHLLKSVRSVTGNGTVIDYDPHVARKVNESNDAFALVQAGLEGVIYEESEAQASHFTNMVERVAGKTGTAERAGETATGWFVAYVPADEPKYVIASVIEQGGFGSTNAMYVVRDVMGAIYNEPDESTAVDESGVR